ncbi:peptidoglycan-recognition protein SB2-like [Macrosteles quadrilineatus]|uniref:peptidoglycan-recognition protein SB2-like n=1 Tax=Macrosteles quadrilineatus TaxID=74068 RepID=UPI0023E262B8|nr:peptidoglycan-recognition protein SB2-like [Macrosteles quadrilineatus]
MAASTQTTYEKPLRIVYRQEWGAAMNDPEMQLIGGAAVPYVLLTFTNTDPCEDNDTCMRTVKELQTKHMNEGLEDIQWNFMVGGTGRVYEGRGWEICADKDVEFEQYHKKSIDIAYIGRYGENHVTPLMEEAVNKFVKIGIDEFYIDPDFIFLGHKEHKAFQG